MSRKKLSDDPRALAFDDQHGKPLELEHFTFTFGELVRLGDALLRWADDNAALVHDTSERTLVADWKPQRETHVLLAAAKQCIDHLAGQTGGSAPTQRSVMYRLVQHYGMEKCDETIGKLQVAAA